MILDASPTDAIEIVLLCLHVRLKSPNALWRLILLCYKAVLEGRGFRPIFLIIAYVHTVFNGGSELYPIPRNSRLELTQQDSWLSLRGSDPRISCLCSFDDWGLLRTARL